MKQVSNQLKVCNYAILTEIQLNLKERLFLKLTYTIQNYTNTVSCAYQHQFNVTIKYFFILTLTKINSKVARSSPPYCLPRFTVYQRKTG